MPCRWGLLRQGGVISAKAPGNSIRDLDFVDPNKHNVFYTIMSSFKASNQHFVKWIFNRQTGIVSVLILLFCFSFATGCSKIKNGIFHFLFMTRRIRHLAARVGLGGCRGW